MAGKKTPSGKMVFKSISTGEYVSEHQYLAEIMVKRHADSKRHTLIYKYWNKNDFWAKEFKNQVVQAGILLKKYSIRAIINAIQEIKWAYSLRTKVLIEEIKRQQEILNKKEKERSNSKLEVSNDTSSFKGSFVKKGILGKGL